MARRHNCIKYILPCIGELANYQNVGSQGGITTSGIGYRRTTLIVTEGKCSDRAMEVMSINYKLHNQDADKPGVVSTQINLQGDFQHANIQGHKL